MSQLVVSILEGLERLLRLLIAPITKLWLLARFRRVKTAPGETAYIQRERFPGGDREFYACPHCMQDRRTSHLRMLNITTRSIEGQSPVAILQCHRCELKVEVETDHSPFPEFQRAAREREAREERWRQRNEVNRQRRREYWSRLRGE